MPGFLFWKKLIEEMLLNFTINSDIIFTTKMGGDGFAKY